MKCTQKVVSGEGFGRKGKVGEKRSRVGTHSIRVEYGICFLSLNTDFVGSTNTINLCFILLTIYISIPVSGCVVGALVY